MGLIYNGQAITPAPIFTLGRNFISAPDGSGLNSSFTANLKGTLLPNKGSPNSLGQFTTETELADEAWTTENDKFKSILNKQQAIRALFGSGYRELEWTDGGGLAVVRAFPTIKNISFQEGTWTERCDYNVQLEFNRLYGPSFSSELENEYTEWDKYGLTAASETYNFTEDENDTVTVSVSVSASAKDASIFEETVPEPIESVISQYVKSGGASTFDDGVGSNWAGVNWAEGNPDGLEAFTGISIGLLSDTLQLKFDLSSIDDAAQILGVEILIRERDSLGNAGTHGVIQWRDLTGYIGTNLSDGSPVSTPATTTVWGGPTEMWGLELTPAMLKDPDWSLGLRYTGGNPSSTIRVNWVQINVYVSVGGVVGENTKAGLVPTQGWKRAKDWVLLRNTETILNANIDLSLVGTGKVAYNKNRVENWDVYAGSYSLTSTYTLDANSTLARHYYTVKHGSENPDPNPTDGYIGTSDTINIAGQIIGLQAQGNAFTTRYTNAVTFFDALNVETLIEGAIGHGFASTLVPGHMIASVITRNSSIGTIDYDITYNTGQTVLNPIHRYTVSINDSAGGDLSGPTNFTPVQLAIIPIPNRTTGPIVQNLGTRPVRTRTVSLNLVFRPDYDAAGVYDVVTYSGGLLEGRKRFKAILNKVGNLLHPTDAATYKLTNYSDNYNALTRNYAATLVYTIYS